MVMEVEVVVMLLWPKMEEVVFSYTGLVVSSARTSEYYGHFRVCVCVRVFGYDPSNTV